MKIKHDCSEHVIRHMAINGYVDACSICCRQVGWNFTRLDGTQNIGSIWKHKKYSFISEKKEKENKNV